MTEVSETARPGKVTYDSIDEASQHLAQLCDKAIDAEDRAIELIRKKFYVGASTGRISEISLMRLSEAMVVNLVKRRREVCFMTPSQNSFLSSTRKDHKNWG